jgi:hypothetical protein
MATVGANAIMGNLSYLAVGREITYGTYVTGTAGLEFYSASLKAMKDYKILEEVQTNRVNSNFIGLGKTIEGELEFNFCPRNLAANYLLQNAFGGGPVTSATATGETAGGGAFTHTIDIANFDATYNSLSFNMRKGDSASAKIYEYSGMRANEISFSGEVDEPLKCNVSLIGKDVTLSGNDVSSKIIGTTTSINLPLSFVNGRVSVENSTGSLTSSTFWHVQSFELKLSNDLKSDASSRRIGSDVLDRLPAGQAKIELKLNMRFDTTTAFAAMMAGTRLCAEIQFQGDTIASTSVIREGIKFNLPYLIVSDAGDPEIGGPNEMLSSEINFLVVRDPTLSGGYALRAAVTNNTSTYA